MDTLSSTRNRVLLVIAAIIVSVVGVLGIQTATSPSAEAAYSGKVTNLSSSYRSLLVYEDWVGGPIGGGVGGYPSSTSRSQWVGIGKTSTFADADGFRVPYGQTALVWRPGSSRYYVVSGGQFFKITDAYGAWSVRIR